MSVTNRGSTDSARSLNLGIPCRYSNCIPSRGLLAGTPPKPTAPPFPVVVNKLQLARTGFQYTQHVPITKSRAPSMEAGKDPQQNARSSRNLQKPATKRWMNWEIFQHPADEDSTFPDRTEYMYIYIYEDISLYLSIHVPIYPSIYPSIHLYIYLSCFLFLCICILPRHLGRVAHAQRHDHCCQARGAWNRGVLVLFFWRGGADPHKALTLDPVPCTLSPHVRLLFGHMPMFCCNRSK